MGYALWSQRFSKQLRYFLLRPWTFSGMKVSFTRKTSGDISPVECVKRWWCCTFNRHCRGCYLLDQGQSHDGYPPYQRRMTYSHTASDSALEAEVKCLCLENGYRATLHRWQLRPEHVATYWCLLLLAHFEDGSLLMCCMKLHGIPRPQKLVDLSP